MAAADSVVATTMAALRAGEEEARATMRRRVRVTYTSSKVDGKAVPYAVARQHQQVRQRESSNAPDCETVSASLLHKSDADEETGVTRLRHANKATPSQTRKHSDYTQDHRGSNAVETSKLSSVLAARKAQVGRATTVVGLSNIRQGGWDSDDEEGDEEDDEAPLQTSTVQHAERGSSARAAAPPAALSFERALNLLTDPNASQRYDALTQLRSLRLAPESEKEMLRPLLLRFADSSERIREAAAALFDAWQKRVDVGVLGGALPFLVPVLVERLGTEAQTEPAEEIRAILVSMTASVLTRCRQLLRPYLAEVGAICLGCCRDRHPEVLKGACALMRVLGEAVLQPLVKREGGKAVQPFSAKLIEALLPHLTHRHAAVRVQVLHALEELLLCGAGQSVETLVGWRLENNVPIAEFYGKASPRRNFLADLSRDRSVSVRRRFVQCLGRWVEWMDGADLYEQEVRLVPYIASALFDEDETLREEARQLLEHLGAVYLSLHESDFKEKIEYCHADEAAKDAALAPSLPQPFRCRPSLGARARVRAHFRALIHPIVAELQSWTAVERLQSAKLLEVLLVYTEEFATEFAHQILPALAKAMEDDTPALALQSGRCAKLFARHVPAHAYMPLALSQLRPDALNTLSTRTNYFALMPHLLRGMVAADAATAAAALLTEMVAEEAVCAKHSALRNAMRETIAAIGFIRSGAAVDVADGGVAREASDIVAAVPMPELLLALFLWHGSIPTLLPKSVAIGEGLEEIRGAESGLVAQAAASVTEEVVAMLTQAEKEAAGVSASAELVVHALRPHTAALNVSLEAAASSAPAAAHILRLLLAVHAEEMLRTPPPDARTHAPQAAKTKLIILEVDDVDDDDDDSQDEDGGGDAAAADSGRVNGHGGDVVNKDNDAPPQSAGRMVHFTDSALARPALGAAPQIAEASELLGEQPKHHACDEIDGVNDVQGRPAVGKQGGLGGCDRGGDGKQNNGGGGDKGSGMGGVADAEDCENGDAQSGEVDDSDDEEEVPITLVGAQDRDAPDGASPDESYQALHASQVDPAAGHVAPAAGTPRSSAEAEAAFSDSDEEEDVPIGKIGGRPLDEFEDELD